VLQHIPPDDHERIVRVKTALVRCREHIAEFEKLLGRRAG
jgi:hypothetical protein